MFLSQLTGPNDNSKSFHNLCKESNPGVSHAVHRPEPAPRGLKTSLQTAGCVLLPSPRLQAAVPQLQASLITFPDFYGAIVSFSH